MFLGELNHSAGRLAGIGPASAEALSQLGMTTVGQLLRHFPRDYENRSETVPLRRSAAEARNAHIPVIITGHSHFGRGPKTTLKILVTDLEGDQGTLVCFNRNFLAQKFKPGTQAVIFGAFEWKYGELQSASFELESLPVGWKWGEPLPALGRILPVYPLNAGLTQTTFRKAVAGALKNYAHSVEDELPDRLAQARGFLPMAAALAQVHFPDDLDHLDRARRTLIYQEFFHLQLTVLRRGLLSNQEKRPSERFPADLRREFLARLPFGLTEDQKKVIGEIDADLASGTPMARLLQGDVGSGKTLVAFVSALGLIQAGYQVALMAPTELLALQHAENAARFLDPVGVKIAFLSGNVKAAGRSLLLGELALGRIDFVVGTHALFSQDVRFKNLRYVIIDEQHRFGVAQRKAILLKGERPDLLLMSATPIPRTLALTAFGDLRISVIHSMPPGRKPVVTHLAKEGNQKKVYEFVRAELKAGRQAYFVYPLIESSESLDLKDAITMYDHLKNEVFPEYRLGLIHSRLDEEGKKETMEGFLGGLIHILVATSVVEVGVDVANATCMVIEHADRFGLSALHQMRGRVGRSEFQSYCFLVFSENLSEVGRQRLLIMKDTADGFKIAEEDLRIRGPGEMVGLRQSGYLRLSIADFQRDAEVLVQARKDVLDLLAEDPVLARPDHQVLARLLEKAPPFDEELTARG